MLTAEHLSKTYGEGPTAVKAIAELNFSVSEGELVCIVGPSGSGKTSLLRMLSGLMEPTSGRTVLDGETIHGPPRNMAMVFQDYGRSLMPWLTVVDNVKLPLRLHGVSAAEQEQRAMDALREVDVADFAQKHPWQLSGGMQQRVAIARAIAYQPEVLLMDEPFASLDAQTRSDLEDLMLKIRDDRGMTIIFVTHDIDESVYLGDRVIVLSKSPTVVQQIETVDLPSPRDQVSTKEHPNFIKLRATIARAIRREPQPTA